MRTSIRDGTYGRPEHVERKLSPVPLERRVRERLGRGPGHGRIVLLDDQVARPAHREVEDRPGGGERPRGRDGGRAAQVRVPVLDAAVRAGAIDEAEDQREADLREVLR